MKVNELRETIKKYNEIDKEKIIVELYKRIPKYIKEDYSIDEYIINVNSKIEKENTKPTIENLEKEVNYFIECANNDLYVRPNKIISKNERSKWRFKVKNFYKQLNNFLPSTEEGDKATDLLKSLFNILSFGTHYLTFSNWNTFSAIQVSQSEFIKNIVQRKLSNGVTREKLKYCIELLNVEYDPQEYHRSILYAFESGLKTPDARYMAIELLKDQVELWKEKYQKDDSYENKEYTNYFVECILDIHFELCEIKEGITYFHKKYIEKYKEIKEYILLEKIEDFSFYKEWILEYEKHLGKISYRDSLKEKYEKYKKESNTLK